MLVMCFGTAKITVLISLLRVRLLLRFTFLRLVLVIASVYVVTASGFIAP